MPPAGHLSTIESHSRSATSHSMIQHYEYRGAFPKVFLKEDGIASGFELIIEYLGGALRREGAL